MVDGDTIDVTIDVGFDFKTDQRLRLYGINTPERNELNYQMAKTFVIEKCFNKEIQVTTYGKDSFGRWLSIVYVDGENLNELLLLNGYAIPYLP